MQITDYGEHEKSMLANHFQKSPSGPFSNNHTSSLEWRRGPNVPDLCISATKVCA